MTRIKLLALSTATAAMVFGSSIGFASSPSPVDDGAATIDAVQTTIDADQQTEMLKPKPGGRRGGAGFNLRM